MTLLPGYRDQLQRVADRRARHPRWSALTAGRTGAPARRLIASVPLAVSVLVAVGIAAAAVITLRGGSARRHAPASATNVHSPVPPSRTPEQGQSAPAWLASPADRFVVLRGPVTAAPSLVAGVVGTLAGSHAGAQLAHRVALGSGTLWIEPAPSRLCLAFVASGSRAPLSGHCATWAGAERAGVQLSIGRGGPHLRRIVGVVPDGVSAVRIHRAGGPVVTARVDDNVFVARVGPGHTRIRLVRSRSSHG